MTMFPFRPPEEELRSHPLDFADRQLSERRAAHGRVLRWETALLAAIVAAALGAIAWANLT
jgi:hypothetical protein